jgi:hypothetical protein
MSWCSYKKSSYKKNGTDIEITVCCSTDNCNTGQATYTGLKCYKGGIDKSFPNMVNLNIPPYEYGNGSAYCEVNISNSSILLKLFTD